MPLAVSPGAPTLFVRRAAYERAGLVRASIDERLGLTPDEFHVEGDLVAIGPIYDESALSALIDELETLGLEYYDDYFELSGNWPEWMKLFVGATPSRGDGA